MAKNLLVELRRKTEESHLLAERALLEPILRRAIGPREAIELLGCSVGALYRALERHSDLRTLVRSREQYVAGELPKARTSIRGRKHPTHGPGIKQAGH
jgi:hypothetical protein